MLLCGGVMALVLVVAAVLFGLELGVWFSLAMIALALRLFWYVLRLFSRR